MTTIVIQVGSVEVLLSDAIRFVEKAKAAGVPATLRFGQGMQHVNTRPASYPKPEEPSAALESSRLNILQRVDTLAHWADNRLYECHEGKKR